MPTGRNDADGHAKTPTRAGSPSELAGNLFPRWRLSPELTELWDNQLKKFSREQWDAAIRRHRVERKGADPDLATVIQRLKGDSNWGGKSDLTPPLTMDEFNLREHLRHNPRELWVFASRWRDRDSRFAHWEDSWFVVEQHDGHKYVWTRQFLQTILRERWVA